MKKLALVLALFALVFIALTQNVLAQDVCKDPVNYPEYFIDPPYWGVCLSPNQCGHCNTSGGVNPSGLNNDPNYNVVKRQFVRIPGTLDILTPDRDAVSAPSFCSIFANELRPFSALYGIGIDNGISTSNSIMPDPPHMAGFNTSPGEPIFVPNYGDYTISKDFIAMLLYVGNDPTTGDYVSIKYSLNDNPSGYGYTIYIFGLGLDPGIKAQYDQANSDGRWYLKGFKKTSTGNYLGVAKGNEIWVAGRYADRFIDPRSKPDWWSSCNGNPGKSSVANPAEPPGFTKTDATPISIIGPNETVFGQKARDRVPTYKPLGSLEACPIEVPLNGKITNRSLGGPNGSINPACTGPFDPEKYYHKETCEVAGPEPSCCAAIKSTGDWTKCEWADRFWCTEDSCQGFSVGGRCGAGLWTFYLKGSQINNPNKNEGFSSNQKLPACIPTADKTQQCVSECSTPIDLTENLQMFPNAGCARNGDCLVNLKVADSLNIPFVRYLGDYFTGVIDAEHMGTKDIDALQQDLRNGITKGLFANAGVAKKLLPGDIQDKLKCEFIDYVKQKKADVTNPNTKYLDRKNAKEFMVYDKNITEIPCRVTAQDKTDFDDKWSAYWFAVPLFQNDDTQGEIQFVSPSIFSTKEPGNNPLFPKAVLGPVHISVPEVGRLAAATNLIQSALIPAELIDQRVKDYTKNPKMYLPTYGLQSDPVPEIQACNPPKTWESLYQKTNPIYYDSTQNYRFNADSLKNPEGEEGVASTFTDYSRGVECNLTAVSGKDATDLSKVCVVGPDGQLRCYQQHPGSPNGITGNSESYPDQKVQVRTVVPNLFEIAEQTIQRSTGFLRIFQPKDAQNTFESNYNPIPAAVPIKYQTSDRDITITENPNGWQLFFYRLGGLWNARNFVLKALNPPKQQ